MDSPEMIEKLLTSFSELLMMDKNTVDLMIDEMQEDLDRKKKELVELQGELGKAHEKLRESTKEIASLEQDCQAAYDEIKQLKELLKQYEMKG